MSYDSQTDPIACREYSVSLRSGRKAKISFTLGAPDAGDAVAKLARDEGALAYGLVSISDDASFSERPLVWTHTEAELCITAIDEHSLEEDLQQIVARYLAVFFADISSVAPELAALRIIWQAKGDGKLN